MGIYGIVFIIGFLIFVISVMFMIFFGIKMNIGKNRYRDNSRTNMLLSLIFMNVGNVIIQINHLIMKLNS